MLEYPTPPESEEYEEFQDRFNGLCSYTLKTIKRLHETKTIENNKLLEQMQKCKLKEDNFEACQCLTKIWKDVFKLKSNDLDKDH